MPRSALQAYQQAVAAPDETARQAALRQHVQSLRGRLKNLASKDYSRLEGLHSLDFVLLFVPLEAAFCRRTGAGWGAFPGGFRAAYRHRQSDYAAGYSAGDRQPVAPGTSGAECPGDRRARAGWLYDKFTLFVADLDEIGTRLQQLDKAYARARNKLVDGRGNLVRRAEQLRELGARTSKQLPAELLSEAGGFPCAWTTRGVERGSVTLPQVMADQRPQ